MQPQSGMILAKSFYRVIGTLVGSAAVVVFVGLFAQTPELFLLASALWIGLCTVGSAHTIATSVLWLRALRAIRWR
jgi:uncharacterized membrane protein YccC